MIAVTILHAPRDKVLAQRLATALISEGFEARFSDGNPDAGDLALEADVAIVVWSASAVSMPRLLEQAEEAMNRGILIPVAIGGGNAPAQFSALQPVNLFGWTGETSDPRWRFMLDEIDIALKRSHPTDRAPASAFSDLHTEEPLVAPRPASARPEAGRRTQDPFPEEEVDDDYEEAAASAVESRLAGAAYRERARTGSFSTAQVAAGTGVVLALLAVAVLFLAPGPQKALDNNIQTVDGAGATPPASDESPSDAPMIATIQPAIAGADAQDTNEIADGAEREEMPSPPTELRDGETYQSAQNDTSLDSNGAGAPIENQMAPPSVDDATVATLVEPAADNRPFDVSSGAPALQSAGGATPAAFSSDTAEITDLIAAVTAPSEAVTIDDASAGILDPSAAQAPEMADTDELAALTVPDYDPDTFIIETSGQPPEPLGVQWLTGHYFLECVDCPEMAEIPAGRFTMGSPMEEPGRTDSEGPQVKIELDRDFALSAREVTFKQWQACVADGGCRRYYPADNGWGRGDRPVINVSFEDAIAYAAWLSEKTGSNYRLPTEAEWEYAARAGGDGVFGHARAISPSRANFDGRYPYGSPRGDYRSSTMPVASFAPNAFGLYDMHGNVWEWTVDCWTEGHANAPSDGSPRIGDCAQRVLKGGAWNVGGWRLRSAHRIPKALNARESDNGFRVARDM